MAEVKGSNAKKVRIDFNPWKNDYVCDACQECHGGLVLVVDGRRIDEDDNDGVGPRYDWVPLVAHILKHLGADVPTKTGPIAQPTGFDPSPDGLRYLRESLEVASFEAQIFVNDVEQQ